jgi:two-component sensor histidine kinase
VLAASVLSFSGPALVLDGAIVQTLTLLVHELATNTVKYGALSNDIGRVHVRWAIGSTVNARFKFRWQEPGGLLPLRL